MSSNQIFNILFKTIMSLLQTRVDDIYFNINISMVKTIYVRGPTLACLAMVLVLLSIGNMATSGELSTWFPLGKLVEQERLPQEFFKFSKFRKISKFRPKISTFQMSRVDRTFLWHYHFSILFALSKALIHYLKLLL